jgi:hypothetical protein
MNLRRIFILLIIIVLLLALKPKGVWAEMKRSWAQRERILRVLVVMIGLYLLYGLYSMYQRGMIPW